MNKTSLNVLLSKWNNREPIGYSEEDPFGVGDTAPTAGLGKSKQEQVGPSEADKLSCMTVSIQDLHFLKTREKPKLCIIKVLNQM